MYFFFPFLFPGVYRCRGKVSQKFLCLHNPLALMIAAVTQHQHSKEARELMHELLTAITNEVEVKFSSNTVDR